MNPQEARECAGISWIFFLKILLALSLKTVTSLNKEARLLKFHVS